MNALLPATLSPEQRLLSRGLELLRNRQHAAALPLLEIAARQPGASSLTHGLLAEALLEAGRTREALTALEAVADTATDAPLLTLRARVRRALGQQVEALTDASDAVIADPSSAEARQMLAACLSDGGRHDESIIVFGELVGEAPEDLQRLTWLATAFVRGARFAAADELLAHLAARLPASCHIWVLSSENAFQQKDYARAAALAQQGIETAGPDATLFSCLGAALHRMGQRPQAQRAYGQASRLRPEDGYLAHLAAALADAEDGDQADRASDGYVRQLFDHYADRFEASLIGLGYRVPGLILKAVQRLEPQVALHEAKLGDVLDLGCGTGLVGVVLHDLLGGRLVGVDLSSSMVESARAKGVYTELHVAEIGRHLATDDKHYDLVIAADVFCYFGALAETFACLRPRLAQGGRLIFTVERAPDGTPWELSPTARYRHSAAYLRTALSEGGLEVELLEEEVLRQEAGEPVHGFLVVGRAAGA